jgi:hypothetical protein
MKTIDTNHPYWKNHLFHLIEEKWEKREKKAFFLRWTIGAIVLESLTEKDFPMIIRELITPYLEENVDQIKDFSLSTHRSEEDSSLIIDMKVDLIASSKTLSYSGIYT